MSEDTMVMEYALEIPVSRGLYSGYIEEFLLCQWTMRRYRKFTQFSATNKAGARMILTTVTESETDEVKNFLTKHARLEEYAA